jgi:hypothetical protein
MMKTDTVIKHFGNKNQIAKALGISHVSVVQWKTVVPLKSAVKIHRMTGLLLELEDYDDQL